MRPSRRFLRSLLSVAAATFLAAGVASAAPSWSNDQDISDGDVNDTFMSNNGQRFMAVDDSNNLYVAFYDNRFKVQNGDNNFEIFFRRFIYNFGPRSRSGTGGTGIWPRDRTVDACTSCGRTPDFSPSPPLAIPGRIRSS